MSKIKARKFCERETSWKEEEPIEKYFTFDKLERRREDHQAKTALDLRKLEKGISSPLENGTVDIVEDPLT